MDNKKQRKIFVVVDNDSWILPFAIKLVSSINLTDDQATFCDSYDKVEEGDVAFLLGCTKIATDAAISKNTYTLVVHESDLPKGRGFAPIQWQLIAGRNEIPICLLQTENEVDSGAVFLKRLVTFDGHELNDEIRFAQGQATIEICLEFLNAKPIPIKEPQSGEPSYYTRRYPEDSRLDPDKTISEQFNLLRTVDNDAYPAFFTLNDTDYIIRIEKRNAVELTDSEPRK